MSLQIHHNPLFINTVLLGGSLRQKISAARDAGFDQIELWGADLEGNKDDLESVGRWVREQSIGLTDYQVLRDFDGAPDEMRESKQAEALCMLEDAVKLGATTLLTTASSDIRCVASRIDEDMRWLAREAASRQLRIAYEAVAWSMINFTLPSTWELVRRLNEPNLGVVVDTFHIFARNCDARDLAGIPIDRVFLVQLSDANDYQISDSSNPRYREDIIQIARHLRLLPGQGQLPIQTVLQVLAEENYSGPIGIEVFNDGMKGRDPGVIAREAIAALRELWPP